MVILTYAIDRKTNEEKASSKKCVYCADYNATTHIIFRNYDNEKGFARHSII